MPTVKWVDGWYDNKADVPVEVHGALTTIPMPVLTLDDIEAWLMKEQAKAHASILAYDDLLAQVRAWKEQP